MGKGNKEKSSAEQGIQQTGQDVYGRGRLTPQEEEQYKRSFELGKSLQDIQQAQLGIGAYPSGYKQPTEQFLGTASPLGQNLYQQTLRESQDPYAYYESQLQPQLQLAENYINQRAQGRGLIRSGIPIREMGTAGIELAIAEANARMQSRAGSLARTAGLEEYIQGGAQNRLAGLSTLYGQQQGIGQQAMGRQASQAQAAGQYAAYSPQAALGSYYGGQAALQGLPAAALGAIGTIGGAMLGGPVGAIAGGTLGAGAGRLGSSFYDPINKINLSPRYPY